MEFVVESDAHIPDGTPDAEVNDGRKAEAAASAKLGQEGHLVRLWRPAAASGTALRLYRAGSPAQLDSLLGALPTHDSMRITVTPLEPHPNGLGPRV